MLASFKFLGIGSMKILVLGGTQMVGRDFVETLQETHPEYVIYIANRGITNKQLFSHLNHICIDRNNQESCAILAEYVFDIVIDFSCYNIDQYKNVIKYITYNKYILISTQSVLDIATISKKDTSNPYYWYCINKQKLEEYVLSLDKNDTIIVRPGAIYGLHDYTDRFEFRNGDFFWKNTDLKPTQENGCVYIKDFTLYLTEHVLKRSINHNIILQIP